MKLLLQFWMNLWMPSFFGIGMGPSQGEYRELGAVGNIGNFATSTGMGDISAASDFWKAILSGDQSQPSRVLGPAYSNISKRGGEELKTLSEFGTRSGGTAAAQQQIGESERGQASALEGGLIGSAASNLGSIGGGLLSTGLSAHEIAFGEEQTIQQQKQAKLNDIFKSIMDVATSVATLGAGAGATAAFGKLSPTQISGAFGGPTSVPTTTSTVPDQIG
jgi:hypothetical protein